MFYTTLKSLVISLILLVSITSHSYADFYVIPVVKEVCAGTPTGIESFSVVFPRHIFLDDIYQTEAGDLIIITGISYTGTYYIDRGQYATTTTPQSCYLAPDALPEPAQGIRGAYYCLFDGEVAYADNL